MSYDKYFIEQLESCGIKPTASRLSILREMYRGDETVSLPILERLLPDIDKSTISRTLGLFMSHRLIHAIDDGSGSLKYNIGGEDAGGAGEDGGVHTHFYCEQCRRTFCLKDIEVPQVSLPGGFVCRDINYVIKGLCPKCAEKHL